MNDMCGLLLQLKRQIPALPCLCAPEKEIQKAIEEQDVLEELDCIWI